MSTATAPIIRQGLGFCFFEHLPDEILLVVLSQVVTAPDPIVDPTMLPATSAASNMKHNHTMLVPCATTTRSSQGRRIDLRRQRAEALPRYGQASQNVSVWMPALRVCQKWHAVGCQSLYENSTMLFTNPNAQLSFVNIYPKAASLVQSVTLTMQCRGSSLFANATQHPKFADMPSRFSSLRRLTLHFIDWEQLEQVNNVVARAVVAAVQRPNIGNFSECLYALPTEYKKRIPHPTKIVEPVRLAQDAEAHMLDYVKLLRRQGYAVEEPRVTGLEELEDMEPVEKLEDLLRSGPAGADDGVAAVKKRRRGGKKRGEIR